MARPVITPLPPAPTPSDTVEVFDEKAFALVDALEPQRVELNKATKWVEDTAGEVDADLQEVKVIQTAVGLEVGRAKTEADRSKTEADRSKKAADDAVAVVTDGGGSIDPEAGKWPVAGSEGTIKQAWVHELEFALDALRVATNKALYGDGPYPVMDFQFAGAEILDPRIDFKRASADWGYDSNGVWRKFGVDEPVLGRDGLRVWGARTNLQTGNESMDGWATTRSFLEFDQSLGVFELRAGEEVGANYVAPPSVSYTEGVRYVASIEFFDIPEGGVQLRLHQNAFGSYKSIDIMPGGTYRLLGGADVTGGLKKTPDGYRAWVSATATASAMSRIYVWFTEKPDAGYVFKFKGVQLEEGYAPSSFIRTGSSAVTIAPTNSNMKGTGTEFTLAADAVMPVYNNFNTLYGLGVNNANEIRLGLSIVSGVSYIRLHYAIDGITSAVSMPYEPSEWVGTTFKTASRFKKTGSVFSLTLAVNGHVVGSIEVPKVIFDESRSMAIGRRRPNSNTLYWNEAISQVTIYNEALTDDQLIALTS